MEEMFELAIIGAGPAGIGTAVETVQSNCLSVMR